ncbi:MAG: orotidine-5'-phosphate decarboxylase [Bifidobacteriaceae bacterium]|jgi:orotidine-5'-phosphate decarboxylase|nr:orotidine-5'-phosphate decarboxylase [Bifidobacteriaceae bacterium]
MTPPAARFGARLAAAMAQFGPVCVGIDPHPALLGAWGLDDDGPGLERFGRTVVEAAAGHAAAVKPQSALFERRGVAGVAALAAVLRAAREAGILAILDVKRGDIGSTMAAYAEAYLADGADLAADAITVSPFPGFDSLAPALDLAEETGRGVFVLALTSNPSGPEVQHARGADGRTVAAAIAEGVARRNRQHRPLGDIGLVVGATVGDGVERAGIDLAGLGGPILAPGFGAQGAGRDEVRRIFAPVIGHVVVASSRAILAAGPQSGRIRDAIIGMREDLRL